jgi:hypothetical protein
MHRMAGIVGMVLAATGAGLGLGPVQEPLPQRWLLATAYAIPKETTNQGSGYFSIVCGKNGRLYIGTAKYGVNAYLVEFDPQTKQMRVVVDAHKEIGTTATGFAAQAKIHTRNFVGPSGKIYFGTKQGYPEKGEKRTDYPGGYPMVYDPATGRTRVYPIPVPHQGIISFVADEARGLGYVSTCSDERPVESSHFLVLDLERGTYTDLLDTRHMYAFIVLDHLGRAYHPVQGGRIARYDPQRKQVELLRQEIDGQPPAPQSRLADPDTHPLNWDVSPDGKTLYCVPMSTNQLYAYDLTGSGEVLRGRSLGPLLPQAQATDCRALCVGPRGDVWAAVTQRKYDIDLPHLVHYRPGMDAPRDLGPIAIRNPDYTQFTDASGKPLPWHHGIARLSDGTVTTRFVLMGVCQDLQGAVNILAIGPYTLLRLDPPLPPESPPSP